MSSPASESMPQENLAKELLGDGGALKTAEVCTAEYKAACDKLGIQ